MTSRFSSLAGAILLRFLSSRNDGPGPAICPEGPLTGWPSGTEGVIVDVMGCTRLAARLRELGAVPGARIRVLRTGCPCVVQVEEGRFCLRRADAQSIVARPALSPQPAQSQDTELGSEAVCL